MTPHVLIQAQGFHVRLLIEFLQACLQGPLDGLPQSAPPHLQVMGQGRDGDVSGEQLVHRPGEGAVGQTAPSWGQAVLLPPRHLPTSHLPAPVGAPGPHEDDGDTENADVMEESGLPTVGDRLDPAGRTEHLPGVGLHLEAHPRR